jgi:hypothetical protein
VQITLSGDTLYGVAIEPDGTEFDHFAIVLDELRPTLTRTPTEAATRTPTATLTPTATETPTQTATPTGTPRRAPGDYLIYLPLIIKVYSSP